MPVTPFYYILETQIPLNCNFGKQNSTFKNKNQRSKGPGQFLNQKKSRTPINARYLQ